MILVAGLSPAWQQILRFDAFQVGRVNRAVESRWCASGKAINVAVAATALGERTSLITAIGGAIGDILQREISYLGIHAEWIATAQPTRVCTTILDEGTGRTTELVESAPDVGLEVLEDFVDRCRVYASSSEVTVLTGSLPEGAPPQTYARILRGASSRFVLDVRGEPLLHCLPLKPFLVKPNREELQSTLGRTLATERDVLNGMRSLNQQGAEWVVVSDGPRSVWVTSKDSAWRLQPPTVKVVNPIGCGDCLASGIAAALHSRNDVLRGVQFGIGVAAHNAEILMPARVNRKRCEELAEQVTIKTV